MGICPKMGGGRTLLLTLRVALDLPNENKRMLPKANSLSVAFQRLTTSAKEVMLSALCVRLFVCLFVR